MKLWHDLALLIEDNPVIGVLTVRHMEQKRFNVVRAENGDPAIEIVLMQHPDALLMGKEMGMNGERKPRAYYVCPDSARRYWRSPRTSRKMNLRALVAGGDIFLRNPSHVSP